MAFLHGFRRITHDYQPLVDSIMAVFRTEEGSDTPHERPPEEIEAMCSSLVQILEQESQSEFFTDGISCALYKIAEQGIVEAAEILLRYGADINFEDPVSYYNPLHVAVFNKKSEMIKLLVAKGADIEKRDRVYESSPLDLASEEEDRLSCLLTLLDLGADVNASDKHGKTALLHALFCAVGLVVHNSENIRVLLEQEADCRGLDGLQRYSPLPTYLPVNYKVLNADLAFFLKESNQDFMRNSSLMSRTESFFIYQSRSLPVVNSSYGPLSVQQPVPLELLQSPGTFPTSSLFTFNWKVQTFIMNTKIHLAKPKVQVLFYVVGRDWDDYSAIDKLPCVHMYAFHETQEVRGTCQLKGELGLCVAELEPLASWFSPPSVVPGRQRNLDVTEGTPVELYYMLQSTEAGECHSEEARKDSFVRSSQEGLFGSFTSTPLRRIGGVRLYQNPIPPQLAEHRLDNNFIVLVPETPMRQRETVSAFISVTARSPVELFTLRVKLKEGVTFLGARPCNPTQWMVSQDVRSEGHRVVTLHCRRKESSYDQPRFEMEVQRVLQVDLKMESFPELLGSRWMAWQVEYPASRTTTQEAETEIQLAQEDLVGIVPLAMDSEILNTAVLTGKTVAVPVKVVTIGIDGSTTDVSEAVKCRSTDEDVVKVSERCDYVFVNGKEMKGKVKMMLNFTYGYLSAQLQLNVWIPRLPLQIEVSDTELSQIKGWKVPITANSQRSARNSEDEDDEDRRGRTCALQYQHATVRVLTHFIAESANSRSQTSYMLGTDWQVDITELVWEFVKVENQLIAQLLDRWILVGRDTGMTTIQVLSPLSDSILAEKTVTVVEEKVTITELGVQLVTGLSMSLQLSPGSNKAILATTTTQEVLQSPKQEALISAWLQFSDGSVAPLDLYNPDFFVLTATSLAEEVVTVHRDPSWKWPVIVTEAEGQGLLIRVEMTVCEICQKLKRRSVLAAGNCNVRVKFGYSDSARGGSSDYVTDGDEMENGGRPQSGFDNRYFGSSVSDMEDGVLRRATTTRSTIMRRPGGDKLSDDGSQNAPIDFADFPAQVDLPRGRNLDDDLAQTSRGLTDLEIGMYALLGVFCLAILVFLINCISYTLKYRHKELTIEGQESLNHAHDWVWLGNEAELLESQISLSPQQEEHTSMIDSSSGLEEGSHLLNGGSGQKNVQTQVHRGMDSSCLVKDSKGDSPTTKRKRVKFTTFTTIPSDCSYPTVNTLTGGHTPDIQWVCQDVELEDSKELRNYMERLNDSALKEMA
ncbi:transmembrane protein 132C isoform X1 [Synchiropus splendidus]|uniref:transmembrane protein 132C isoform X1 n=1 Tax=Synchiropus splendidus TaxID=270530 RepID=UPI00237E1EE3|nr:transmembrane protein 132C isoform X1 [Synchiropus splendidus]